MRDGFPYSFETYLRTESELQQGVVKQFALKTETVNLKTLETTQRLISELIAVPFATIPLCQVFAKSLMPLWGKQQNTTFRPSSLQMSQEPPKPRKSEACSLPQC